jgi:hypothetical protein
MPHACHTTNVSRTAAVTTTPTSVNTELQKVGTESAANVKAVADLTQALADAQAAGGTVTPELEAAINRAKNESE